MCLREKTMFLYAYAFYSSWHVLQGTLRIVPLKEELNPKCKEMFDKKLVKEQKVWMI